MTEGRLEVARTDNFREFDVVGGYLSYEDSNVLVEVFGDPSWKTDFGSLPDLPLLGWLIPYIGDIWDDGFLIHDALWQMREYLKSNYSMEWTNELLYKIHREAVEEFVSEGKKWYNKWYRRATCEIKIRMIQLGLKSKVAKHKWNNPSNVVKNWQGNILKITKKGNK
jgi:hypothetical protein